MTPEYPAPPGNSAETASVPPASAMRIVFWPSGPTNSTATSSGKVCDKLVSVTLTSLTELPSPETAICEGYGDAVPALPCSCWGVLLLQVSKASLIVMPSLLENVPAEAAGAARVPRYITTRTYLARTDHSRTPRSP